MGSHGEEYGIRKTMNFTVVRIGVTSTNLIACPLVFILSVWQVEAARVGGMEPIIMTTVKSGLPYFLLFHDEGGFGNGAETLLENVLHKK